MPSVVNNNDKRYLLVDLFPGGPSSRCEESLVFFFFFNLNANDGSASETRYPDIVTAVIYCYITTLRET